MDFNQEDDSASIVSSGPYIPDAAECMRCGMCVSSCPTFRLFKIDAETPRQRVRTISKILVEEQVISDEERLHLDNCLQCRACETACPSRMNYGQLFDQAQSRLNADKPLSWISKGALGLIEHKRWRQRLLPVFDIYRRSGAQWLFRKLGLPEKLGLAAADQLSVEPSLEPLASVYPSKCAVRGRVALFTGCLSEHFDRATLTAAIEVLNAIGYEVLVPEQQGCCGAIHQHQGLSAQAFMDQNLAVFNDLAVDALVYTATGCGAMLSEYQSDNVEALGLFKQRLQEINAFLLSHWPDDLALKPLALNVALHEPCSQRNVLKNTQATLRLLQKIPELNLEPLADNSLCCGAGGSYMLTHPDNADQLRTLKRLAIGGCGADVVASSNFGCLFYLQAGQDPAAPQMLHPLQILVKAL